MVRHKRDIIAKLQVPLSPSMKRKRNDDLIDVSLSFAVSRLALVNTKYLGESPNLFSVQCLFGVVCY